MHRSERLKVIPASNQTIPKEVNYVVSLVKNQLSKMPPNIERNLTGIDYMLCWLVDGYWTFSSDFEDGTDSCFWDGEKWMYRQPWDGSEHPVFGGLVEVVGHIIKTITKGAM